MLRNGYDCFDVTIEDKVAHLVLKRGDALNTMTKAFWNELPEIVEAIDSDALARVIVISSTGKHFSAGMDLANFAGGEKYHDHYVAAEAFRSNIAKIQSSFNALENARVPVLFALQGGVIGGAIDMVCAGDIRWCTTDTFFTIAEINIAMTADVGTFPRLQQIIPLGWVKELAYTGRKLTAQDAERIGLVNGVFDTHEAMLAHVLDTAREIASKNPIAVTGSKVLINYGRDHTTADTLDYIGVWNASMLAPPHMKEAFEAKTERREPVYPDLAKLRRTPM
ncbi:MAG: enoyl-CoA hydratase-related protein [Pseudomonadota bacterium]